MKGDQLWLEQFVDKAVAAITCESAEKKQMNDVTKKKASTVSK